MMTFLCYYLEFAPVVKEGHFLYRALVAPLCIEKCCTENVKIKYYVQHVPPKNNANYKFDVRRL